MTREELLELCDAALHDHGEATKDPWRCEFAYNNGGMPTASFYIPGHNGEATVEMLLEDAEFIVNARAREHVLAAALKLWLTQEPAK